MPDDITPPEPVEGEQPVEGVPPEATAEGDVEGGEGAGTPAPEAGIEVPALPPDLSAVDEVDLRTQYDAYEALYQEHRPNATPETVEALEMIRHNQGQIATELRRRREDAEAAGQRIAALDGEAPALPDAIPVPALASAGAVTAGRDPLHPSEQTGGAPAISRPRAQLLAGVGAAQQNPGTPIAGAWENDFSVIGEAIDTLKSGSGAPAIVASLQSFDQTDGDFPDPLSDENTATRNSELIREAQDDFMALRRGERPAKTAAICEPFDINREIPDNFDSAEPVASSLPSRPIGRLGFQHYRSIALSALAGAIAEWNEDDQAAVDPTDQSTWKPCIEVPCPTPTSVSATAVTACLTFDNTTEMSSPEIIRNYLNALDAQRARVKEARILQKLDLLTSAYSYSGDYGAQSTLVAALNSIIAQAVYANRQDDPNYTLYIDPLVVRLLTIDRAAKAYGIDRDSQDVLSALKADVDGVTTVVTTLDASAATEPGLPPDALVLPGSTDGQTDTPGGARAPIPPIDGAHRVRLIDPRTFIYAQTGKRDTGVQRSPEMMRQNKAQLFGEEYFLLDRTGPWANFNIDVTLCADGSRAGLIEPTGCVS